MEYLNTWILIGAAGFIGTVALFFATSGLRWWPWLVTVIRLLPLLLLTTPAPIPAHPDQLVPAFIVLLFEGLFQSEGAPGQAAGILIAVSTVFLLLVSLIHWRRRRSSAEGSVETA